MSSGEEEEEEEEEGEDKGKGKEEEEEEEEEEKEEEEEEDEEEEEEKCSVRNKGKKWERDEAPSQPSIQDTDKSPPTGDTDESHVP